MAKLSYEYDGDDGSSEGGSTFRLIALIVVIGAITGALIWWLMPDAGIPGTGKDAAPAAKPAVTAAETPAAGTPPASPVAAPAAAPAAAGAESTSLSASEGPTGTAAGTETPATPPASGAAATADPKSAGDGEKSDAPAPETPSAATADPKTEGTDAGAKRSADAGAPTPIDQPPVKGKPWAGDPPEAAPPPPDAAALAEQATTAANALIFDSGKGAGVIYHTAKAGDALGRIARNNHTTIAAIMRLNRLTKTSIRIGQKLAVLPGPWRIEVVKSQKKLRLYRSLGEGKGEELFFAFDVGIGRRNSTPTGDFAIYNHVSHPEWTAPDGTVYPYGDPGNPLGDYFLRFAPAKTPGKHLGGYGIHGSRDGEGVGLSISSGCIRMRNRDVELVFLAVPNGTPVSIKD